MTVATAAQPRSKASGPSGQRHENGPSAVIATWRIASSPLSTTMKCKDKAAHRAGHRGA
jgi:hypothetical protein